MLRNGLENAFSFASGRVRIQTARQGDSIEIVVEDDGPGISDEALKGYGERRVSRMIGSTGEGRLSVGLGSVIMRTVAEIHGGSLKATRLGPGGTRIEIRLPSA
jgi:K+-sensing histidine kinase KdpD